MTPLSKIITWADMLKEPFENTELRAYLIAYDWYKQMFDTAVWTRNTLECIAYARRN